MRSNELAELAGITVRTLRHYHQIGLLEEPERSANGYRRYTVQHLATVLRILSFTALGVPLAEVRQVMNDSDTAEELLDRLDQHASAEIDRLSARRLKIAELKAAGAMPDVPAALLPYASLLEPRRDTAPQNTLYEREQFALLDHFTRQTGMPWMATAFKNLAHSATRYVALTEEFANLNAAVPADQRQVLVDEIVGLLSSAVSWSDIPPLSPDATALLVAHRDTHYNETQRLVWAQVLRSLGDLIPPR